jgi:hypothetical protein
MIELSIQIQQVGSYLVMKYHSEENPTSTRPERNEVKTLLGYLQEKIAKDGGKGTFVENDPNAADLPDFPDFGQPRDGGIAHGDDN